MLKTLCLTLAGTLSLVAPALVQGAPPEEMTREQLINRVKEQAKNIERMREAWIKSDQDYLKQAEKNSQYTRTMVIAIRKKLEESKRLARLIAGADAEERSDSVVQIQSRLDEAVKNYEKGKDEYIIRNGRAVKKYTSPELVAMKKRISDLERQLRIAKIRAAREEKQQK